MGVILRGTGCCLPSRVVTSEDIAGTFDVEAEWILSRTGIRERRYAGPLDTSATLGAAAAREALIAAGMEVRQIDLIVCATITPDLMSPSTACLIQALLGLTTIPAFDVTAACSGFLYAIQTASAFLRMQAAKHALVIGTDTLTRTLDFSDRNTCILFGDGAGAAVLSVDERDHVHVVRLYADGSKQEFVQVPSFTTPNPPPGATALPQLKSIRMNGREVYKFAVTKLIELIEQARADCREHGLGEIALMVPHQVNQRILDSALETTGFPASRVMVNLDRYGNTSAASVPIALDEAIRGGRARKGDTVLLAAFGGGLTWSSALITI